MECMNIEERLSEYLDRSLPPAEMAQVAEHLHECSACSMLMEEMRSVLVACKAYPKLEPDLDLIEKILLRTSGRPRTRTFSELLRQYFLTPLLTPRFAVGAALVVLFAALSANLLLPRAASFASLLSPREWVSRFDRGVQAIYSEGLKAYDTKNEWQARATFLKNNLMHSLGFYMEQLDVPVEGKQKTQEPKQREPKGSNGGAGKSSSLFAPAGRGLRYFLS
jgi:hypothetical protein